MIKYDSMRNRSRSPSKRRSYLCRLSAKKKSQVASLSRELKATTRKKSGITKLLKKYGASDVLTALASANQ